MSILQLSKKQRDSQKELFLGVQEFSSDMHNQHTPLELCEEIVENLIQADADFSGNILIVSTIEFIPVILRVLKDRNLPTNKIWLSSWNEYKRNFAVALGINILGHLLDEEIEMKFDVIIGNPPYQGSDSRRDGALWPEFIAHAKKLCKINGSVALLTPIYWIADDSLKELNIENNVITVSGLRNTIFNKVNLIFIKTGAEINKNFNVGVDICYFIFSNSDYKYKTTIQSDFGTSEINIKHFAFIPKNVNESILSILNKTVFSNNCFKILTGSYKFRIKDSDITKINANDEFKYPFVTTSAKFSKKIYGYSKTELECQTNSKVIWSNSGYNAPFYDDGNFGLGDHSAAILVDNKNEAENLIWFLTESKIIKFLQQLKVSSGYVIGFSSIQKYIPNIKNILNIKLTDEELYQHFNLTQEEIDLIESTIK